MDQEAAMQDRKSAERQPQTGKTEAVKGDVAHARQQQHTGNHERHERETPQPYGADTYGGTRAGAGNVERDKPKSNARGS